jgi:hypothetical protein
LIGRLPIPVRIDGIGRELVMRALDPDFHRRGKQPRVTLDVEGTAVALDLDHANQRLLYYALPRVIDPYDHASRVRSPVLPAGRSAPGAMKRRTTGPLAGLLPPFTDSRRSRTGVSGKLFCETDGWYG